MHLLTLLVRLNYTIDPEVQRKVKCTLGSQAFLIQSADANSVQEMINWQLSTLPLEGLLIRLPSTTIFSNEELVVRLTTTLVSEQRSEFSELFCYIAEGRLLLLPNRRADEKQEVQKMGYTFLLSKETAQDPVWNLQDPSLNEWATICLLLEADNTLHLSTSEAIGFYYIARNANSPRLHAAARAAYDRYYTHKNSLALKEFTWPYTFEKI